MRSFVILLSAAALLALPANAQPAKSDPGDAALAAKAAHDAELADQNRRSEALNVEVNKRNAEITARNASTAKAYADAKAAYEKALAAHDAELARLKAESERTSEAYATAHAAWEAQVAACKAGHVDQCDASQAPPPKP